MKKKNIMKKKLHKSRPLDSINIHASGGLVFLGQYGV